MTDPIPHFDVLIVGAGLSGIGAACHLKRALPEVTWAIVESRDRLGGTWDLFRYPGIRSDSDMYTLGYSFRPWTQPKAIADGPSILAYIEETAREYDVLRHIRFGQRVERARWSTEHARWTVTLRDVATGETREVTCGFFYGCTGYYDYESGYTPELPGLARFQGTVVHPQKWTDDIAYEGKRVVVIGSGATAVTLVPELAKRAAHVTMLQRTPTYVVNGPLKDPVAEALRGKVSESAAYHVVRAKNVLRGMFFYGMSRRFPDKVKRFLVGEVEKELGAEGAQNFSPSYKPWDQRVCFVPDGDLFESLRSGRASVENGVIDTFTETGLRLVDGREIEADLVVTATGLKLKFLGGATLSVDGREVVPAETLVYRGMMFSDVPNLAIAVGYTNASWTLKCDLTSEFVCRVLGHMRRHGHRRCVPHNEDPAVTPMPLLDFTSGYVLRDVHRFPRQGSRIPWRVYQNYALDRVMLRHAPLNDGALRFS